MYPENNPYYKYLHEQIDHYKRESLRLGSKEPMQDFLALWQSLQVVQSKLGGLEHDVALAELQKGFSEVRKDILRATRRSWRNFWCLRKRAEGYEAQARTAQVEYVERQKNILKLIAELRAEEDYTFVKDMIATLEELAQLDKVGPDLSEPWRDLAWAGLWVDSKLLVLYLRYVWARARVFLQFHTFVFVLPILVLGIGYSLVSNELVIGIASLAPDWIWLGPSLLVTSYAIKKYIIDKKLKRIQKTIESSLYEPLAWWLFISRNTALARSTFRMGRRGASLSDRGDR